MTVVILEGLLKTENSFGYWMPSKRVLAIDSSLYSTEAWSTLIHECLHAASAHAGVHLTELKTRAIESGLAQLMSPFLQGHPLKIALATKRVGKAKGKRTKGKK